MNISKLGLAAMTLLACSSAAKAGELGLLKTYPDVYSNNLAVEYTVSGNTGTLFVQGSLSYFDTSVSGPSYPDSSPTFTDYTISMTWDKLTEQATGGTLTIDGSLTGLTNISPLLTGNLSAFGFPDDSGDNFQFLFTPTGGSIESYYAGQSIGVSLHPEGLNTLALGATKFSSNFNNDQTGNLGEADSFATAAPEPASTGIVMLAAGLLLGRKRRTR